MKVKLDGIKISHIAAGLPKKVINISDYERYFDPKAMKRIIKSTGVESVHVSEKGMCSSDYVVEIAKRLMKITNLSGKDFDGIVFISQTPDYVAPATSTIIQDRLGLPQTSVAFDINQGCNGYIYGIYQASLLVSSGSCKRVIVCVGDTKLSMVHEQDRTNRMLLGEGFAVTIVEQGNQELYFNINCDGSGYNYIIMEAGGYRKPKSKETAKPIFDAKGNPRWLEYLHMEGMEIMNFVLTKVPILINETLKDIDCKKDDIGVFVMHQPNQLILQFLMDRLEIESDKMPIVMKYVGNTSSASIPITLSTKHLEFEGRNALNKVILCAFGIGLSWGAIALDLSSTVIHDTWII